MKLKEERRVFVRYPCNFKVSGIVLNKDIEFAAQTFNISAEGLGLKTQEKLIPGDNIEIWIHLKGDAAPLHTYGKIMWIRKIVDEYKVGVKFDSLHLLPLGVALEKNI